MGIIRGRVPREYEIHSRVVEYNGPSPYFKCDKTGRYFHKETNKEASVLTFKELKEKYKEPCPCGEEHG